MKGGKSIKSSCCAVLNGDRMLQRLMDRVPRRKECRYSKIGRKFVLMEKGGGKGGDEEYSLTGGVVLRRSAQLTLANHLCRFT